VRPSQSRLHQMNHKTSAEKPQNALPTTSAWREPRFPKNTRLNALCSVDSERRISVSHASNNTVNMYIFEKIACCSKWAHLRTAQSPAATPVILCPRQSYISPQKAAYGYDGVMCPKTKLEGRGTQKENVNVTGRDDRFFVGIFTKISARGSNIPERAHRLCEKKQKAKKSSTSRSNNASAPRRRHRLNGTSSGRHPSKSEPLSKRQEAPKDSQSKHKAKTPSTLDFRLLKNGSGRMGLSHATFYTHHPLRVFNHSKRTARRVPACHAKISPTGSFLSNEEDRTGHLPFRHGSRIDERKALSYSRGGAGGWCPQMSRPVPPHRLGSPAALGGGGWSVEGGDAYRALSPPFSPWFLPAHLVSLFLCRVTVRG